MLRRVAVILRGGLFVMGVAVLVGLPVSYRYVAGIRFPSLHHIAAVNGYIAFAHYAYDDPGLPVTDTVGPFFNLASATPSNWKNAFFPALTSGNTTMLVETDHREEFPLLAGTGDEESTSRPIVAAPSSWGRVYVNFPAKVTTLRLPLWLLAAICLVWPVTSLLLARRRRKGRGFTVEAAGAAAPPAIDLHIEPEVHDVPILHDISL